MGKAESVGLSSSKLALMDEVMAERYVESGKLPGFHIAVMRDDEIAHSSVVGSMDLERNKPLQEDSIYRIYSMTKPITAVALMMLVEEGKLGLDDDVHLHIPSWKDLRVYVSGLPSLSPDAPPTFLGARPKRPMKVIDLVTHTSGLTYGFMSRTSVDAAYRECNLGDHQTSGGLDEFIEQLSQLPLDFSPGENWNYSVSIDVMGYLVQKLSGQSFGEFLRTRIFEPLGMTDTAFHVPSEKVDRFTSCYFPKPDGGLGLQDDAGDSTYAVPPKLESGGGGLVSTTADYLRFCQMMLNRGSLDGARILSPKTVAMFSQNLLPNNQSMVDMLPSSMGVFTAAGNGGVGFSIGCGVIMDAASAHVPCSPGEYFWGGAASTIFWIDPKENMSLVFMTQVMGFEGDLRRDLRTLAYSAFNESYI